MSIEIMNLRNIKPLNRYDIKIDRSSPLGNPFYMANEKDRNYVCDLYQGHFEQQLKYFGLNINNSFVKELERIKNIYKEWGRLRLFCWCAPKRCHGETIKNWLESNK